MTVRITGSTYRRLDELCERHNLSQADVIEALVEQEHREMKRLKGKQGRYKRT